MATMTRAGVRIERDFLGEAEVPIDAYYGLETLRGVENFPISGLTIHPALIRGLGRVKKAAALANRVTGYLDPRIADAIGQAAGDVIAGNLNGQFIVDPIQGGAGASINANANEVIANRALEILGHARGRYDVVSPTSHVNRAQSETDAFPTAVRVAALELGQALLRELHQLHDAFAEKEREFDGLIKIGRANLQDAEPIRLGQEFGAYRRVVGRDFERIRQASKPLHEVNLGATTVGTGLNADPDYIETAVTFLADVTGFPMRAAEDLVDATQNTDWYTEVSGSLKVCATNLSKVVNDLRLMASGPRCGLAEIALPTRQPASPAAAGAVSPGMAEVVNQVAFQVIGNDQTICLASEAGQLERNAMQPVMAFNLLQSIGIMANALAVFRKFLVDGIKANAEHMRAGVEGSAGLVAVIRPHVGHALSARIAREARATGRTVRELALREGALSREQLDVVLDTFEMTRPGIAGGGVMRPRSLWWEEPEVDGAI